MINEQILQYIRQELASGRSKEEIRTALKEAGWLEINIDKGFFEVERISSPSYAPPQNMPVPLREGGDAGKIVSSAGSFSSRGEARTFSRFSKKLVAMVSGIFIILVLLGGGVYAYVMRIGPFSRPPYTEKNLVSGVLGAIARIDTSSYLFSASLNVRDRDSDAKSFISRLSNESELRVQYQNDAKRARDVSSIFQTLQTYQGKYPASLEQLASSSPRPPYSYYGNQLSITDPRTERPYEYSLTENGKNFAFAVTFETHDAVSQVRRAYNFSPAVTRIDGKRVTFTKDSSPYLYVRSEPPKPYLVQLSESFGIAPSEASANISARAETDWRKSESADWKFNVGANGDFGDLSYKVDIDALKKDGIYYVKVNNMPSFFLGLFGGVKGQWIEIDPNDNSESGGTGFGGVSYLTSGLPEAEKAYKKNREELVRLIRAAARIADEENFFILEKAPYSERVDNRILYRYDLAFRKSAIVPFYKRLIKEIETMELAKEYRLFADEGYLEYLESPEFDEIFDYYDKNTAITFWADPQGYPAMITYSIRVVPPDSVAQLKEKQVNLLFTIALSDINKPIDIEKPDDAKPLSEFINKSALGQSVVKSRDARRISDVKQLQLALELYFDAKGGYPTSLEKLTPDYIPMVPADPFDKTAYRYTYYVSKGKNVGYHLGASIQDGSNYAFSSDADCNSTTGKNCGYSGSSGGGSWSAQNAFDGSDAKGCGGEADRYCFDVVP